MALRLAGQDDNTTNKEQSDHNNTLSGANPWEEPNRNNGDKVSNIDKTFDDPWEYEGKTKARSIADKMDSDVYVSDKNVTNKNTGNKNVIVTISGILLYVLFALSVCALAWISIKESPVNIYDNIKKVQPLFSILSIYVIIDAIIVFVLNEKRISLIVFAVVLSPFYPIKRNKVINGSGGIGGLITLAYIIGIISLTGSAYKGFSTYGNIIRIEDQTVRRDIVAMLDQPMDSGITYGQLINKHMRIVDAAIEERGGQTFIALTGIGDVSLANEEVFEVGGFSVNTALVFSRDTSGNYNIVSAQLGDKMLTERGAKSYWHAIKAY